MLAIGQFLVLLIQVVNVVLLRAKRYVVISNSKQMVHTSNLELQQMSYCMPNFKGENPLQEIDV